MSRFSNLGNEQIREQLLISLIEEDQMNSTTADEILAWIKKHTYAYGVDVPLEDIGGALALLSLCLYSCGIREEAITTAELANEKYGSVLGGILVVSYQINIPFEELKTTVLDSWKKLHQEGVSVD
jgi:hypothetical protein